MTSEQAMFYKPQAINVSVANKNLFTAIVAVAGMSKPNPVGVGTVTVPGEILARTAKSWIGRPVVVDHIKPLKVGKITAASYINDELQMAFEITNEAVADFIRNDAFKGFSLGFDSAFKVNKEGFAVSGAGDHLAVVLGLMGTPACGKDRCHVIMSPSNFTRGCLHTTELTKEDVVGLAFDASIFTETTAREYAMGHCCRGEDMAIETQDGIIYTLNSGRTPSESKVVGIVNEGVVALFSNQSSQDRAIDKQVLSLFSITPNEQPVGDSSPSVVPDAEVPGSSASTPDIPNEEVTMGTETPPPEAPVVPSGPSEAEKTLAAKLAQVEADAATLKQVAEKEAQERQTAVAALDVYRNREKDGIVSALPEIDADFRQAYGLKETSTWNDLPLEELRKVAVLVKKVPKSGAREPRESKTPDNQPPTGTSPEPTPEQSAWSGYLKGTRNR